MRPGFTNNVATDRDAGSYAWRQVGGCETCAALNHPDASYDNAYEPEDPGPYIATDLTVYPNQAKASTALAVIIAHPARIPKATTFPVAGVPTAIGIKHWEAFADFIWEVHFQHGPVPAHIFLACRDDALMDDETQRHDLDKIRQVAEDWSHRLDAALIS